MLTFYQRVTLSEMSYFSNTMLGPVGYTMRYTIRDVIRNCMDDPVEEQGNFASCVASDMASHIAFHRDHGIIAYRFAIFRTIYRRLFSASYTLNVVPLVCQGNQYESLAIVCVLVIQ